MVDRRHSSSNVQVVPLPIHSNSNEEIFRILRHIGRIRRRTLPVLMETGDPAKCLSALHRLSTGPVPHKGPAPLLDPTDKAKPNHPNNVHKALQASTDLPRASIHRDSGPSVRTHTASMDSTGSILLRVNADLMDNKEVLSNMDSTVGKRAR